MKVWLLLFSFLMVACSTSKEDKTLRKAELHYGHGTASLMRGDYTTALDHLLSAVRIKPKGSEIHNNLGMAYYFKDEKKLAKAHIRKALELNPKNTDAKMNLASIYINENQLDDAQELYEDILKDLIYQYHYRTYYNLGIVSMKRNNVPEAREHFTQAIKLKEDYCSAHFQLGLLSFKQKEYKNASDQFSESYKGTCFSKPAPHYYSALSLIKLKKYDDARIKLNYMMRKFKSTEYDAKARLKLSELDAIVEKDSHSTQHARNNDKHFAPDF